MLPGLVDRDARKREGFAMTQAHDEKKVASHAVADEKKASPTKKREGKVVSMTGEKLVMSDPEGKQYTRTVAKDAKVTCDGHACKTENIKAGQKIRITTQDDDRNVATCVEFLDKQAEFASCS